MAGLSHQAVRVASGRSARSSPPRSSPKISGCHQSENGATAWLSVRSYLDSARRHGLGAFEAIYRAFTGNP
ncbi:hypothetical protein GA0115260_101106 [Streptomyces sp. MnatMP-M27]|nr:hypothetical protein GA0115260_101106 [Streptomyces sp. MnatMP-M27]